MNNEIKNNDVKKVAFNGKVDPSTKQEFDELFLNDTRIHDEKIQDLINAYKFKLEEEKKAKMKDFRLDLSEERAKVDKALGLIGDVLKEIESKADVYSETYKMDLQNEINKSIDNANSDMQKVLELIEKENFNLKTETTMIQEENKELSIKNSNLESINKDLEANNLKAEKEIERLTKEIAELNEIKKENNRLSKQVLNLQTSNIELRDICSNLEHSIKEIETKNLNTTENSNNTIQSLKLENATLKAAKEDYTSLVTELRIDKKELQQQVKEMLKLNNTKEK